MTTPQGRILSGDEWAEEIVLRAKRRRDQCFLDVQAAVQDVIVANNGGKGYESGSREDS